MGPNQCTFLSITACPQGYAPFNGKCYHFNPIKLSYMNSAARCAKDNDRWPHPFTLVTPLHASEMEAMLKIIFR